MVPESIRNFLEEEFGQIQRTSSIHGGSINRAVRIDTSAKPYFLKWNSAGAYPGMFEAEAAGLELLGKSIHVPETLKVFEVDDKAALLLSYVQTVRGNTRLWEKAGRMLARLHAQTTGNFGGQDNYMGSLPQSNTAHASFAEFFMEERIIPCVTRARNMGLIQASDARKFSGLNRVFEEIYTSEPACLVHGDLWGGNLIFDESSPVFIDPAVAYSSRHCDLAMTTMFGRFPDSFYAAYKNQMPYTSEEEDYWELLNLYPLLVHLILFGRSYLNDSLAIMNRYTR